VAVELGIGFDFQMWRLRPQRHSFAQVRRDDLIIRLTGCCPHGKGVELLGGNVQILTIKTQKHESASEAGSFIAIVEGRWWKRPGYAGRRGGLDVDSGLLT